MTKPKVICTDCRFANWEKTATGRLSPSGAGGCTWTITAPVATAVKNSGPWKNALAVSSFWRGGPYITRKPGDGIADCANYERRDG
jgi:hypothetical protein